MTYITIAGDTWDIIALRIWNNEKYAKELVEANLKYVDVVIFSSGAVLNIPEVNLQQEDNSSLPPWKRGNINAST